MDFQYRLQKLILGNYFHCNERIELCWRAPRAPVMAIRKRKTSRICGLVPFFSGSQKAKNSVFIFLRCFGLREPSFKKDRQLPYDYSPISNRHTPFFANFFNGKIDGFFQRIISGINGFRLCKFT
jgi:hypothetical protein